MAELERQLHAVAAGAKNDPDPGNRAMAAWILKQDQTRRTTLIEGLRGWLSEPEPAWHSASAIELSVLLNEPSLLKAAVDEARRRGVHDVKDAICAADWLPYHLGVISAIARMGGPRGGIDYLSELKMQTAEASSNPRRLVAIRAWIALCFIEAAAKRDSEEQAGMNCLAGPLKWLRSWGDKGLLRSGLSFIYFWYTHERSLPALPRKLFDPRELRLASFSSDS